MAKGKRFYKKNPNAPEGQGAPEQNAAAGGENVNKKYENKSNGGQGGKPGQGTAGKPGGKPPRKFRKNNWDGNKDRNAGGKGTNREGNAERGSRPEGKGDVAKGNTYRILPVKAYPSMYGLCVAKAGMEKASGARPELKGSLPDCSRYEKIAIGFPIWWFSCPNIIHSFLEKVNLEGKKVYPFCTSKTSGPKSSSDAIRSTVPKADVKDCLDANKLDSMTDEDIKKWLEM